MSIKARGSNKRATCKSSTVDRYVQHQRSNKQSQNRSDSNTAHNERAFYLLRSNIPALSLWMLLLIGSNHVFAAEQQTKSADQFTPTIYAGAGVGVSRLEPNTNKIDGWEVDEKADNGGQINVGVDLFKQLSFELHAADLGSAGLSPSGRIHYHIDGISALVYAGRNRHRFKRRGLTAYGRGGYGLLSNTAVGEVPFRKVDANLWLWGAGVEYMHQNGFGARAEVISFSKDAKYGQLGLIYRFGQSPSNKITQTTPQSQTSSSTVATVPDAAAPPTPPPPPPPPPPTPPAEQQKPTAGVIAANHCSALKGVLDGIRFDTGSALLSIAARSVLDDVAATLSKCPQLPVIISAHTDSHGSQRTNQILSQRRAWAVINYLRGIGIDLYRLIPRAFGEDQPIDSNNTAEGRRNNRRVELIAR